MIDRDGALAAAVAEHLPGYVVRAMPPIGHEGVPDALPATEGLDRVFTPASWNDEIDALVEGAP
jgi:hypothetical protein